MFKRLIWFGSGAVSGVAGGWYVKRRIQEKLRRFTPGGMREQAMVRAKKAQADAKIALTEARRLADDYRAHNTQAQDGETIQDSDTNGAARSKSARPGREAKHSTRGNRASRPRR